MRTFDLNDDVPADVGPVFKLGRHSRHNFLFALVELAFDYGFPAPEVKSDVLPLLIPCHRVNELELVVPLGEVFDQSGVLVAFVIVDSLGWIRGRGLRDTGPGRRGALSRCAVGL